jgi:hypothetical protein
MNGAFDWDINKAASNWRYHELLSIRLSKRSVTFAIEWIEL